MISAKYGDANEMHSILILNLHSYAKVVFI